MSFSAAAAAKKLLGNRRLENFNFFLSVGGGWKISIFFSLSAAAAGKFLFSAAAAGNFLFSVAAAGNFLVLGVSG